MRLYAPVPVRSEAHSSVDSMFVRVPSTVNNPTKERLKRERKQEEQICF